MPIAASMAHAFAVVLMLRVASDAARASAPTWSTPGRPCRKRRSVDSSRAASAGVDVAHCADAKRRSSVTVTGPS